MEGRAHSGGGPRKGFGFWGLTPSFLCGGARAREGGGDKISEPRSIPTAGRQACNRASSSL